MFNQYGPQRTRRLADGRQVGTVPVGEIVYIQDGLRPFGRDRHFTYRKTSPWIVEAWLNRESSVMVAGRFFPVY